MDSHIRTNTLFDLNQLYEINEGLKSGVDVSIYAKLDFDCDEMNEIRESLEQGLDVSDYINPELDNGNGLTMNESELTKSNVF